jgi:hypothetical protein
MDEGSDLMLHNKLLWVSPPADLEHRVMAAIEAVQPRGAGVDELMQRRKLRSHRQLRRPALLVAAAAALGAATAVGVTQFSPSDDAQMAMAGTPLATQAHADVELRDTASGVRITMDIERLPPAPAGTFYQGWVKGDRGIVAIGTFHLREGSRQVVLWSGVELADYPKLTVTLQSEGAGPASSGKVVLAGNIPAEAK